MIAIHDFNSGKGYIKSNNPLTHDCFNFWNKLILSFLYLSQNCMTIYFCVCLLKLVLRFNSLICRSDEHETDKNRMMYSPLTRVWNCQLNSERYGYGYKALYKVLPCLVVLIHIRKTFIYLPKQSI